MDGNASKQIRNDQPAHHWRSLAARASVEMDSEKLLNLVSELSRALERQETHYGVSDPKPHENKSKELNSRSNSGFTPRV
jgi:hypothetical protein